MNNLNKILELQNVNKVNINNLHKVIFDMLDSKFPDCKNTGDEVVFKVPNNVYPEPIIHVYSDCNSDTPYECRVIDIHYNGKEYWYTLRQTLADIEDMEDEDCEYDSRNIAVLYDDITFNELMMVANCLL